ncbi:TonB-dependent receptor [Sphingosinicella sp.]|uniref:TonB-dependent receptor n=1 Tax=Sphingosinicella sp. TaxID=1917971 RepID=UPI0017EBD3D6|nr:TonB-dependent receptor [Sphingosinicella sp.]MBA4759009.1 TonB-dependent receptor [Sphingosinicella sp.]
MTIHERFCGVATIALAIGLASPALAQDGGAVETPTADEAALQGEIVVTAQRRAESLQKIPIAVSAIGGDALATRASSDLSAISSAVPGLNVSEQVGQARLTLRGIGVDNISAGAESSVAFNQDGVFFSRSAAALASFYDIERVEVLRGPQGTLYGRNATGGSVNILTRKPTFDLKGGVSLTGGNYDTINAEAYISGGLSDTVAVRLSGQIQNHSGYGTNIVSGTDIDTKHSQAIRGQILFEPSDRLSILVGADYYRSDDRSNSYRYFGPAGLTAAGDPVTPTSLLLGGTAPASPRDIASARDPKSDAEFWGVRADINYEVSDEVSLRSLITYRRSQYVNRTDIDPLGLDIFPLTNAEESDQYTQEFQLNWDTDRNKLVIGVFYLNEKIDGFLAAPFNLLAVGGPDLFVQGYFAGGRLKTEAAAAFAQDTFSLTDTLRLTLGARYSWERKRVADQSDFDFDRLYSPDNLPRFPVHEEAKSFNSFTPKVGLDFDLGPRTLIYASFSKGFKAGTFNLGAAGPALDPEKVDAYEIGLKSTLLDGALRANLSGFYYDYSDLQVGQVRGQLLVLENAATAEIYGLEGEFTLEPVRNFTVGLNASYLHARFKSYVTADQARPAGDGTTVDGNGIPAFNLAGNALPQAPDYTIDLSAEYMFELPNGSLTVRGESYWSDRVYFTPFNRDEVSQPAYNLQNAYITYKSEDGLRVTGFIRNIGNKTIRSAGQVATTLVGSPVIGFVKPPRTYGVTVAFDF